MESSQAQRHTNGRRIPSEGPLSPCLPSCPPRVTAGVGNESRNQLEYITNKARWNIFVQTALCRVPEADVATVCRWA